MACARGGLKISSLLRMLWLVLALQVHTGFCPLATIVVNRYHRPWIGN